MARRNLTVIDGVFVLSNPRDCRDTYEVKALLNSLFDVQRGDHIVMHVYGFWYDIDADDMVRIPKPGFQVLAHTISKLEVVDTATGESLTVTPTDDLLGTITYTIKRPDAA